MVVGEAQILRQVREAFAAAQAERTVGPVLSALFARAIKVGRRARSQTAIGAGRRSTVDGRAPGGRRAARRPGRAPGPAGRGGRLARLAGRALREAGAGELVVANRTPATGAALARELGRPGRAPGPVADELAAADLAVAATAGATPTVTAAAVAAALGPPGPATPKVAGSGPAGLLDLGVPRDVEPEVRGCPGSSWPTWTRSGPCSRPTRGRAARSSGSGP
jgi:glutamyl-tRNA reductase